MTAPLSIDRLVLRVPGLSEPDARRLAHLVADRLAGAGVDHAFAGDRVRLGVTAVPDESLDSLARRIAAELLATIARST